MPAAPVLPSRPRGLARARLAALAAALVASASGCMGPRLEALDANDLALDPAPAWPLPVRVAVTPEAGGPTALHAAVVDAVERRLAPGVVGPAREAPPSLGGLVRLGPAHAPDEVLRRGPARGGADAVLSVAVSVEGSGAWTNGLVCFPGFVVLAPAWLPLRWTYEVRTTVEVRAAGRAPQTVAHVTRLRARYTPDEHHVGCGLGFLAVLFPPMLVSPLVTGVVAIVDPWDEQEFTRELLASPLGRAWADAVAARVAASLDALDLAALGPGPRFDLDGADDPLDPGPGDPEALRRALADGPDADVPAPARPRREPARAR